VVAGARNSYCSHGLGCGLELEIAQLPGKVQDSEYSVPGRFTLPLTTHDRMSGPKPRFQAGIGHKIGHATGQKGWILQALSCSVNNLHNHMTGQNALGDTFSDRACAA
jgi:hypothetical protein